MNRLRSDCAARTFGKPVTLSLLTIVMFLVATVGAASGVVLMSPAAGPVAAKPLAPVAGTTSGLRAPLGAGDFIKADGTVLRTGSGSGPVINLRGTNVGGWLTQEDWMSPLGEFAADRSGWSAQASDGTAAAAIDGSRATGWSTSGTGTWLTLDLRAVTRLDRLTADSGDGPSAPDLAVDTSTDGLSWQSIAAGPGERDRRGVVTTMRFATRDARYIRIRPLTPDAWTLAEVNLFYDPTLSMNSTNPASATATISAPGTHPSQALDGNETTTWQTGAAQTPGQSMTVDLGRSVDMTRVLLDSGASAPLDYPRSWEIYTSQDAANFALAATGNADNRIVSAAFQGFRTGRYLKIVSTGYAAQWWTVAELTVGTGSTLDRSTWTVSTSGGADVAAMTDTNLATRWTSGSPQAPGQWVQVDLGAVLTLNNVALDSAKNVPDEGDWPRGYRLELSRDGSDWTTVSSGPGTFKATSIGFVAQPARYLRIVLTTGAAQWWSIGELTAGLNTDDYSLNATLTSRFGTTGAQTVLDAHQNAWLTEKDLDQMQALGFNYIRVPMGWNTFLNLDGSWKADPWRRLDWIVSEASKRGIYVLLDLHTVPGGACSAGSCGRYGPTPNSFWGTPNYQRWTQDIWSAIAQRYRGNPAVAGYDLMNEPLIDSNEDADDRAQKDQLYDRLYDAVRAVDPDHLIVLGAFPALDSIAKPTDYGWTNVMYELHAYDMSNPTDWTAQEQLVSRELTALPGRLADLGVPMLYGEFSLYDNDDLWASFTAGLNAQHVSWSNWTWKVRGSAADGFAYWGIYYDDDAPLPVINSDDETALIAKLCAFSTDRFTRNDELAGLLSPYATGRADFSRTPIDHTAWTATASSTGPGSSTAGALDGPGGDRWTSGRPQAGGEWFQIDLGSLRRIAMVTVATPQDARWDQPHNFTLQTSSDGIHWTGLVRGTAQGWKRPIAVPLTTARYVRLTQTGSTPKWWGIDDVVISAGS